jgi:acyl-CoA thioesterase
MSRQTPALVTSAAHVGPLREPTHAFSSFITPDNYGHVMQSSAISNRNQAQQPQKYINSAHVSKNESDDSVHHWVRLPTMPTDTTTMVARPNTSYIPDETVVNDFRRTLQENDNQKDKQSVRYPPQSSQDTEIEEQVSILF